jgi:hypothetical protein
MSTPPQVSLSLAVDELQEIMSEVPLYPRSEIPGICVLSPNRGLFTHVGVELQEVWRADGNDAVGVRHSRVCIVPQGAQPHGRVLGGNILS